jgi:hypothetical protein
MIINESNQQRKREPKVQYRGKITKKGLVLIPWRTTKVSHALNALLEPFRWTLKLRLLSALKSWMVGGSLFIQHFIQNGGQIDKSVECRGCKGTGMDLRYGPWASRSNHHTKCFGSGRLPNWPRRWQRYADSGLPVVEVPKDIVPDVVITPDVRWYDKDDFETPEQFMNRIRELYREFSDCFAIEINLYLAKPVGRK